MKLAEQAVAKFLELQVTSAPSLNEQQKTSLILSKVSASIRKRVTRQQLVSLLGELDSGSDLPTAASAARLSLELAIKLMHELEQRGLI